MDDAELAAAVHQHMGRLDEPQRSYALELAKAVRDAERERWQHAAETMAELEARIVELSAELAAECEARREAQRRLEAAQEAAIRHQRDMARAVAEERERWQDSIDVIAVYGGKDGRRDWVSAGAWLDDGDALAVVPRELRA